MTELSAEARIIAAALVYAWEVDLAVITTVEQRRALIESITDHLASQATTIARLRAALEPFAKMHYLLEASDGVTPWEYTLTVVNTAGDSFFHLTNEHLRAAALAASEETT